MKNYDKLIFQLSQEGRMGYDLPKCDVPSVDAIQEIDERYMREKPLAFPEVSELEVIRHYTALSNMNFGVESGFYPLGSCTMKYNPKINEEIARLDSLVHIHPYQPVSTVQGSLGIMHKLSESLAEVSGMDAVTLQPAAGAHGELTGLMMIKAYHEDRGDYVRKKIIIPDSAHGTNPATAASAGFDIIEIKSNERGAVDLGALREALGDDTAGLMLTNPSTLGLFETNIREIADMVHEAGGLLYYDGANMNAVMGITRPGDMGFDVMHFNLHKTFSTPHGGGGPGSGPVGVKALLEPFLPSPVINKGETSYTLDYDRPKTIGKVKGFYGNYGVILKALSYIETMGGNGLKESAKMAVLNANYLMFKLKEHFNLPYDQVCKHEFVLAGVKGGELTTNTLDFAKRLIDYGYHPPTIYFPLIVSEAMMIEPTESESKGSLDEFAEVMIRISKEATDQPELLHKAPVNGHVKRVDEAKAARALVLKYE